MALSNKQSVVIAVSVTALISVIGTSLYYQQRSTEIGDTTKQVIENGIKSSNSEGVLDLETGFIETADKKLKLASEEITFDFDGSQESSMNGAIIYFGPLGIRPESPTDEPFYENYYSLMLKEKRSFVEIAKEEKNRYGESITVEPHLQTIKGYSVAQWSVGGLCEDRFFEIIGKEKNIQLSSSGCHTDTDTDLEYFKKSIATSSI